MEEFSITVKIADRLYRMKVEREQEEIVRKAAELINSKVKEYSATYHYNDMRDLIAMAALQVAVSKLIGDKVSNDNEAEYFLKLREVDELLTQHI